MRKIPTSIFDYQDLFSNERVREYAEALLNDAENEFEFFDTFGLSYGKETMYLMPEMPSDYLEYILIGEKDGCYVFVVHDVDYSSIMCEKRAFRKAYDEGAGIFKVNRPAGTGKELEKYTEIIDYVFGPGK